MISLVDIDDNAILRHAFHPSKCVISGPPWTGLPVRAADFDRYNATTASAGLAIRYESLDAVLYCDPQELKVEAYEAVVDEAG